MNQIINSVFYLFITAYSLLTMVATYQDINFQSFQYWHSFYFIGSTLLFIALLPSMPHWLLAFSLGLLIVITAGNGLLTDTFQWTHIIVRAIISLILIIIWYQHIT